MARKEKSIPIGTRVRIKRGRMAGKEGVVEGAYIPESEYRGFEYDIRLELDRQMLGGRTILTRRLGIDVIRLGSSIKKMAEQQEITLREHELQLEEQKEREEIERQVRGQVEQQIRTAMRKQFELDVDWRVRERLKEEQLKMVEREEKEEKRRKKEAQQVRTRRIVMRED